MELSKLFRQYNVASIWHFTDASNFATIKKYGLLCLKLIEQKGVSVNCFGGNAISHDLDKRYGIHQYVHAAFIPKHPMLYAKKRNGEIKNPIWLEIDIKALDNPAVLYCDKVANATNARLFSASKVEERIDLNRLFTDHSFEAKETQKAQILIPNFIPFQLIQGVHRA